MIGLAVVVVLLPFSGGTDTVAGYISAYVLVFLPAGALPYGLLVLAADFAIPKLLFFGMTTGTVGVVATYLGGLPETLVEGPPRRRLPSCSSPTFAECAPLLA
jgi:hypothetical protein